MRRQARTKDLRAALAWLSAYPQGRALPRVDPGLTPEDYSAEAAQHARDGYPESEAVSLAKMYLAQEIERRRAKSLARQRHRIRYRGES